MLCTNIEDLVSPWDLIASRSIHNQKKRIEESFMMVIEANDYVKKFLRYQWFSVWWLTDLLITQWILIALRHFWYHLKSLLKGFWWPFRSSKSVKYSWSYGLNEVCDSFICLYQQFEIIIPCFWRLICYFIDDECILQLVRDNLFYFVNMNFVAIVNNSC